MARLAIRIPRDAWPPVRSALATASRSSADESSMAETASSSQRASRSIPSRVSSSARAMALSTAGTAMNLSSAAVGTHAAWPSRLLARDP